MSNLELLQRAADSAACQTLYIGGGYLVGAGAVSIVGAGVGFIPLTIGMAGLLAANYLCDPMPLGNGNKVPSADGCTKIKDGVGQLQVAGSASGGEFYDAWDTGIWPDSDKVTEITEAYYEPWNGEWRTVLNYMTTEGPRSSVQSGIDEESKAAAVKSRIRATTGTCDGTSSDPVELPPDIYEPISYTDNITNCTYNVTFQGFAVPVPDGPAQPVYMVEGATQQRNDGGRMGGCNFPPTIYLPGGGGGNGGGGGVYLPVPDGPLPIPGPDGVPWWAAPLLAGSTSAALNLIGNALTDALGPKLPEGSFTLEAPCNEDEAGNPLTQTWTFPEQKVQERMIAHQITTLEVLQTHLNWKTPTCSDKDEKPEIEGQWVTTRWESTEKMAHSGRRLRKLFRYRTKSARDVGQLSAYWEAFTWEAGDVCVYHKGAWWGTPQIWAASQEEGQRVIRFAAAEAGLDPDKDGEWGVGSSRSPRYGMRGTMKVARFEDFPWVASRDGAAWPNVLAKTSDP
jgi:hypothetical protein